MIERILSLFKHKHSWRRMTAAEDYGKFGPHWGGYHGVDEEICTSCGVTREVRGWQAWRFQMDDAEERVQYLRGIEPSRDAASQGSAKENK